MTDMKYRAWVSWQGGERPVSPDTWVEVYPRQGLDLIGKASRFDWSSTNILRYRLCAPDEYHDPKPDSPNEHYRQGDREYSAYKRGVADGRAHREPDFVNLRLECLKLALQETSKIPVAKKIADDLLHYVLNGSVDKA